MSKSKNRNLRRQSGMTLVELLMAVICMGILLNVAIPAYIQGLNNSKTAATNTNARTIITAIETKYVNTGEVAFSAADLTAPSTVINDLGGSLPVNSCTGTNTAADWVLSSKSSYASGVTLTPKATGCVTAPSAYILGGG